MGDTNELFSSIDDLYKRLLPVIHTKVSELERIKFNVKDQDIWAYCVRNIWNNKDNLRIYEMVSDILNIDEIELNRFIKMRMDLK